MTCLFCQIVEKQIPAKIVLENEHFLAFNDIHPKADTHVLVIPKKHIEHLMALTPEDTHLMGALTLWLPKVAQACGLKQGFRVIVNNGPGGGQEVPHLHYQLLAGHKLPGF